MQKWTMELARFCAAFGLMLGLLWLPQTAFAEQVDSQLPERSKSEIVEHWKLWMEESGINASIFAEKPSTTAPYSPGSLQEDYLQKGLDAANFYRYLAGLPSDLRLDPALNRQAQHGAVLVSTAGHLTHYPKQPADMPKAFFDTGYASTSTSNLFLTPGGSGNMLASSVRSYMDDSDASNIDRLGHRRWILSPQLQNIGFGLASKAKEGAQVETYYSAMQVLDAGRGDGLDFNYSLYPNKGAFPLEVFSGQQAWSVQLNAKRFAAPSLSEVRVELTRMSDQRTWTFSEDMVDEAFPAGYLNVEDSDLKWHQQAYFKVNDTTSYGKTYAIIFRPNDAQLIRDGERFSVHITGLRKPDGTPAEISYQTEFFKIDPSRTDRLLGLSAEPKELSVKLNGQIELPTIIASYENGLRFVVESNFTATASSDRIQITDGFIKGLKPGHTDIVIRYEGKQLKLPVEVVEVAQYSDVANHWASDAIVWALDRQIASGYKDGTFKPDNPVSEAEFFAMLFKLYADSDMVKRLDSEGGTPYYDRGAWSDKYYRFAGTLNLDVDASIKNIKLRDQPMTWLQAARFVSGLGGRSYSDDEAIRYMINMGYSAEKAESYARNETLTRADAIVFLKNLKELGFEVWCKPLTPTPSTENEKNGGFPDNTVRAVYTENHRLTLKGTFPEVAGKTFSIHIHGPSPLAKRLQTYSATADAYGNFTLTLNEIKEPSLNIYLETRENFEYWLAVDAGGATVNAYDN